jgi:Sec-independent protein translocase protein TatA
MFGTQDILLIGVIVVVLFGATRLPQLGSGITGDQEFQEGRGRSGRNRRDAEETHPQKRDIGRRRLRHYRPVTFD